VGDSLELTIIAKATVVLTLALVAVRGARRARASVRHVILASAFGALLLLPAAVLMLPPFPVAVSGATAGGLLSARQIDVQMDNDRRSVAVIDHVRPAAPGQPADRSAGLLRSTWSGIALISLGPVVLALWRLHDLRRRGLPWLTGAQVASFAGSGPLVTDDRPLPEYFLLRRTFGARSPLVSPGTLAETGFPLP
jgi:hypothetical protein